MRLLNPRYKAALAIAASLALAPSVAFASTEAYEDVADMGQAAATAKIADQNEVSGDLLALANDFADNKEAMSKAGKKAKAAKASESAGAGKEAESSAAHKVLSVDWKLIEQIGTQEETGHTICCPSFSCAFADAVMDGTVHDHEYYTCSCCTWTDWGGGGSSDRCVGTDEELLREAYDQISEGKPTVIHVTGTSGEHWIALIGYKSVKDPDHLTLENFVALDPWDGAKITASDRYALYGDGCEHISDRTVKAAQ